MVKKVITIKSGDTLDTAQKLMVEHSIRHLPVTDGSELGGILTESDIRSAFLSEIHLKSDTAPKLDPKTMKVINHMTREPLTVLPETNIAKLVESVFPMRKSFECFATNIVRPLSPWQRKPMTSIWTYCHNGKTRPKKCQSGCGWIGKNRIRLIRKARPQKK